MCSRLARHRSPLSAQAPTSGSRLGNESGTVHTFHEPALPGGRPAYAVRPASRVPGGEQERHAEQPRTVRLRVQGASVHARGDNHRRSRDTRSWISVRTSLWSTASRCPRSSDLATRLLRAFWLITNPANYQDHNVATNPSLRWTINYPAGVPVRVSGGAVVDLKSTLEARSGNNLPLAALSKPAKKGVGEVWIEPYTRIRPANRSPEPSPP